MSKRPPDKTAQIPFSQKQYFIEKFCRLKIATYKFMKHLFVRSCEKLIRDNSLNPGLIEHFTAELSFRKRISSSFKINNSCKKILLNNRKR